MVDNSLGPLRTLVGLDFFSFDSKEGMLPAVDPRTCPCFPLPRAASCSFTGRLLTSFMLPFGCKAPAIRGGTKLPAPSIVEWFSPSPWRESVAGSVGPDGCPLVRVDAPVACAALHGDAQNGSRLATTPDGQAGVEPVGKSPRCVLPALPRHDERSDSPAQ